MSLELFMNDEIVQKPRMKVCTKCNTPKPATLEYFYGRGDTKNGLRGDCKECRVKVEKAWYQNGGREKAYKTRHENSAHRSAFAGLRGRVKQKGTRKFLLGEAGTPEAEAYIKYLQTITHCTDCSKELTWFSWGRNNPDSASFDRIDSNGHYTKENVRIVCVHCNNQKSDLPIDEWVVVLEVRVEKGIIEEVDPRLTEYVRRQDTLDGFFVNERSVKEEA